MVAERRENLRRGLPQTVTLQTEQGQPQVRASYRLALEGRRLILENQAEYLSRKNTSRTVYNLASEPRLIDYTRNLQINRRNHFLSTKWDSHRLRVYHRTAASERIEIFSSVGRVVYPYLAFCYAELALLVRLINWNEPGPQIFPMFHGDDGNEFAFRDFYYVLQVMHRSAARGQIRCINLHQGPLGRQTEPYDIIINKDDFGIEEIRSLVRSITFQREPNADEQIRPPRVSFSRMRPPHMLRTRRVAETESPLALSLRSTNGTAKSSIWLYDVFRVAPGRTAGTRFLRQDLSHVFRGKDHGCLTFDELVAPSMVGPQNRPDRPTQVSFGHLREATLKLWGQLSKRRRKRLLIIGIDENNFLLPALFSELDDPPPLVLANPLWTTLETYVSSLQAAVDLPYVLQDPPRTSLIDLCLRYRSPILALGRKRLPSDLSNCVTHLRTRWKSRFFSPQGGPANIPQPWHPSVSTAVVRWGEKLWGSRS